MLAATVQTWPFWFKIVIYHLNNKSHRHLYECVNSNISATLEQEFLFTCDNKQYKPLKPNCE